MKLIPLSQGKFAIVDDEDHEALNKFKWRSLVSHHSIYACRTDRLGSGNCKQTTILMHRVIMNPPEGMQVDHINGNGLDNRRANLRVVTSSQNHLNTRRYRTNKSGAKGVHFHKKAGKYAASIMVNKKPIWLGCFADIQSASTAYEAAAKKYFGEFYGSGTETTLANHPSSLPLHGSF